MTLPTLLKKVGISVPRYVTVAGMIVTESLESHNNIRPATTVQPHRFHGGLESTASNARESGMAWWVLDTEKKDVDIEAMRHCFPRVSVFDDDSTFAYSITLDTGRGRFDCLILPRPDGGIPTIRVVSPKRLGRNEGRYFRRSPHLYNDDNLCVAYESDWNGHNYPSSVAVGWTSHWLACYTEWRMSGQWPCEGYVPLVG